MNASKKLLSFDKHYASSLNALRDALAEGLLAVYADPAQPQEVARKLGINRNLTWKIAGLVAAPDLTSVIQKIPTQGAISILIQALRKAGAPTNRIEHIQDTFSAFESMVSQHAGDRATLEIMLDSAASESSLTEPLSLSRVLAFQGNSGIWGCQSKVRVRAVFIAPNEQDSSMLDLAQVTGLYEMRRFRDDAICPLFERTSFADDGTKLAHHEDGREEIIYFGSAPTSTEPPLLQKFCSADLPPVEAQRTERGFRYTFGRTPVGNTGMHTLIYGSGTRRFATRYRDGQNEWAEFISDTRAPSESLLLDLFVHRDMVDEVDLESRLHLGERGASYSRKAMELPLQEGVQELGAFPPRVRTPLMPRHGELVEDVFAHMHWNADDFAGYRLEIKHPPTPSTALLRYRLPVR